MRNLSDIEIQTVRGGGLLDFKFGLVPQTFTQHFDGLIYGAVDSFDTGMMIGGIQGGAGGFGFGALQQLGNFLIGGIRGAISSGVYGWVNGEAAVANYDAEWRNSPSLETNGHQGG